MQEPMPAQPYIYRARVERVVDGDTLDMTLSLGLHDYRLERLRLLGINCPEVRGETRPAGMAAQGFAAVWCNEAKDGSDFPLIVRTEKDPDHFGRYLALVWRTSDGAQLNQALLDAGHAAVYVR